MANEYVRLHIMKHALEYYVKREGASEKDIRQEKKVLNDVAEELEKFKDFINSGCSGGCQVKEEVENGTEVQIFWKSSRWDNANG